MASTATAQFFEAIDRAEQDPLLGDASGTVAFHLTGGARTEHWRVRVDHGRLAAERGDRSPGDCDVHTSRALFDRVVTGQVNGMAAMLRGELVASGDLELLLLVQRRFPGPPDQRRDDGDAR